MFINRLLLILAATVALAATPKVSYAESTLSQINATGSYFSNNDDHPNNDEAVSLATPQHPLSIPKKTPTPMESYRWNRRHIYIYMDTDNLQIKQAFRDAVKAWNRPDIIHFTWTKDAEQANVFAKSGDLSAHGDNSTVGTNHHGLGSTQSSYDSAKHALLTATSILHPNELQFTSRNFRSEVTQHELGHALGLAHAPEYENSVMIPRNVRSGITKLDRQTLKLLYQ